MKHKKENKWALVRVFMKNWSSKRILWSRVTGGLLSKGKVLSRNKQNLARQFSNLCCLMNTLLVCLLARPSAVCSSKVIVVLKVEYKSSYILVHPRTCWTCSHKSIKQRITLPWISFVTLLRYWWEMIAGSQ